MTKKIAPEWLLIIALALLKLLIHFLTNTHYELHRDAYLYLAQGAHPDWGYMTVPPGIAVLGNITRFFFGDSTFSVRLFPALIGAASVLLMGMMVRELGGKLWAILLSCTAFILSPAFLRSNTLFQPVSFDEFFWFLSTYVMLKLLNSRNPVYWIHLCIVWALAFWMKYNIVFLTFSFCLALLISKDRQLFRSKYLIYGLSLAFVIVLPNLIWQYAHRFPVIFHMTSLRETQLVNVRLVDFIVSQILMNFPGIALWLSGLIFLLFFKDAERFRALGYTYLIVMLIFIVLQGKGYYALGIYPLLFAFGGFSLERYLQGCVRLLKPGLLVLMILITIPLLPYSLPIYSMDRMIIYGQESVKYGAESALRWEDGEIHSLPQDYADMVGWKELGDVVISAYQSLSDSEKADCMIYAENYGEAGAIAYYGKRHGLPEPVCFSESFLFWAPDSVDLKTFIYVNDDTADVSHYFISVKQVGSITNIHSRESGLPVFICRTPRNGFKDFYAEEVKRLKDRFRR